MDELRDYRFYDEDMVHPSSSAVNYIWEIFRKVYFDNETANLWNEAARVTAGLNHRFNTGSREGKKLFAEKMLEKISGLENKLPSTDFSGERKYFQMLLRD